MIERRITRSWGDREANDDNGPQHRVLWDEAPPSSPISPWGALVRRKVVRMPRVEVEGAAPVSRVVPTTTPSAPRAGEVTSLSVFPMDTLALAPSTHNGNRTIVAPTRPRLRRIGDQLDPRLVLLSEPTSERAAAFRVLRDSLMAKGLPRVLAVTSASAQEGATTCAINLAVALAEKSAKVVLVDANFFEPTLAGVFGIDAHVRCPVIGLGEIAPFKLAEVTPSLHVAALVRPHGARRPLAAETQRFEAILERLWRAGYERVIIDAPALDGSPVVSQLVTLADRVLLSVRTGRTRAGDIRRALREIPEGKALGATLIDLD